MVEIREMFGACAFKVLAKSDTGGESGHIHGILIPRVLREIFPEFQTADMSDAISIRARLLLNDRAPEVTTFYRAQTRRGKRTPETRITKNLQELRGSAAPGDILIFRRVDNDDVDIELQIIVQGSPEFYAIIEKIGKRRWGFVGDQHLSDIGPFAGGASRVTYSRKNLDHQRKMIARIERVEAIIGSKFLSVEFDGIDADLSLDDIDRALVEPEIVKPFALTRIISTPRRLRQVFGRALAEGAWAELVLEPPIRGAGPRAFLAQLGQEGYTTCLSCRLGSGRVFLAPSEEPRDLPEAGASVPAATAAARKVAQRCGLPGPRLNGADLSSLLSINLSDPVSLQVRDVGQASFVTILGADGKQLAHFDAGWPISYNDKTAPKALPVVYQAPVILSHWDWDHLHAFHLVKRLAISMWVVPDQMVGPGATKVAKILHASNRLKVWRGGSSVRIASSIIYSCTGGGNLNNSGIAMSVTLRSGKTALLVGDACYKNIGYASHEKFDFLVVTHHGAAFDGDVPMPSDESSTCVVSVGRDNVYRHPCQLSLEKHVEKKWNVTRTSGDSRNKRGNRNLI